jgi:hypothetical protein
MKVGDARVASHKPRSVILPDASSHLKMKVGDAKACVAQAAFCSF